MMEYKGYLAAVELVRSDRRGRDSARVLNLRLGPDLHQRAALSANARRMSLNRWIKQAVEEKSSR